MRQNRMKRVVSFVCAIVLVLGAFTVTGSLQVKTQAAKSLDQIQKELVELQKQRKSINSQISSLEKDKSKQKEYVKALQNSIDNTQKQINAYNSEISALNKEIDKDEKAITVLNGKITEKSQDIEGSFTLFKEHVRKSYMSENPSAIALVLGAESFGVFLSRMEMVSRISEKEKELLDELKKNKTDLEADKAELEAAKKSLEGSKSNLLSSKAELDKLKKQLSTDKSKAESILKDINTKQDDLEERNAEIKKLEAQAEKEIQRIIAEQAAKNGMQKYVGGKFGWPVPGYYSISSPYGNRKSGFHKGIDIAGSGINGKSIVASNAGKVIRVDNAEKTTYGKYLMIDHGGGYVTLYAHCSSISVSEGAIVAKGQTIAKVGNTGNSTGPHLHFEVRVNGSHTNPIPYLDGTK